MTERRHVLVLAVLVLGLLLAGLATMALTDRDEGANAEAAREMLEQGSWITPTLNYVPRFQKPALVYWLMAGGYAGLGVGEAAARLPSAGAGAVVVFLQYAFARSIFGPAVAFRAALILLLAPAFVAIARMALTDAVLVLWTTAAGFAFFRAYHGEGPQDRWYTATYLAMALATLTKGPVGILIPAAGIASYLTLAGGWRRVWRDARPGYGLALILLVAGPWYAAMFSLHGGDYLARARGETIGRVFRTVTGPGGTVLFYIPVVLVGLFPWGAVLPGALWSALRGARARARADRAGAAIVFSGAWILAVLVMFSLFQSRLPHYVAPLFPAAALLLAASWPARLPGSARALLGGLGLVVGAVLIAAWALGPTVTRLLAPAYPAAPETGLPPSMAAVGIVALAAGATAAVGDGARAFRTLTVLTTGLLAIGLHVALPAFSRAFVAPAGELARAAAVAMAACDRLVVLGPYRPSLLFYARRATSFVGGTARPPLATLANPSGRLFVLAPRAMADALSGGPTPLAPLERRGGYVLLAGPTVACPPAASPVTPPTRSPAPLPPG